MGRERSGKRSDILLHAVIAPVKEMGHGPPSSEGVVLPTTPRTACKPGAIGEPAKRRAGESENGESETQTVSFPIASVGNPETRLALALGRCSSCSGSPPKTRGDDKQKETLSFPNVSIGNPETSLALALGRCSSCSGSPPKTRGDDKQKETLSFPNVSIGNPELSLTLAPWPMQSTFCLPAKLVSSRRGSPPKTRRDDKQKRPCHSRMSLSGIQKRAWRLPPGRCNPRSGSPPKTCGDDKQKETLSFPNVSIGNPELSSRNAQS